MSPLRTVEKLRQLVQAGAAQQSTHGRHPVVVLGRLFVALRVFKMMMHGAKFPHLYQLVVETIAFLFEQDGAGRGELDHQGEHQEQRRQ